MDTDGDQITDEVEVTGFLSGGRMWYSAPRSLDSNNDGLMDSLECPQQARPDLTSRSPAGQICQDSDGDGTPDIFDRDNDGDGVPDAVDLSPFDKVYRKDGAPFDAANPLLLQVDSLQPNQPAFVDFQLRPVNPDHLWQALNVLDWPSGDETGQIQRRTGNNSTFADLAAANEPIDDKASNGDMRLIPMLEIEMTGDSIPLALTTPAIGVAVSGEVTGSVHMEQQGGDIHLDFALETAGAYTVKIYDGGCPASGTALYTFESVSDGSPRTITGEWLTGLADGEHAITFSGPHDACADIGNVINGPYDDRMIDQAALDPYGIIVREKDNAGTLLAYAPLSLVADETGSDNTAFGGAQLYWPTADQWGDTQQVRVVWLVEMIVDRCTERPCDQDENWLLDQTQTVHVYGDEWYLTGLAVREDHGLDVAIIYEDPAQKTSAKAREYEDALWMLAWGLDSAFITGRDEDQDGQRDITIAEIYNRWGDPDTTASDTMRWNIPVTATDVVTFSYEHQGYAAHIAMTETRKILNDVFLDYVDQGSDAPTLLFAQEAHYRCTSLGSSATTTRTVESTVGITLRLDPAQSREETTRLPQLGPLSLPRWRMAVLSPR